jgi:hypothetical protein
MAEFGTSQSKTFLSINGNGKLAKKATETTPGAVKSVYNSGTPEERTVWQMEFGSIKGKITGMYYHKHEKYGESLNVIIDNEYALQLKVGTRYYYSFVRAIPNVDLTQDVKFNPWRKEKADGKISAALYLNQGDGKDSIQWLFTKDNPNGMPEMKKVMYKGKEEWDDTDMQVFCKKYIEENILPKLAANTSGAPATNNVFEKKLNEGNTPAANTSSNYQVNNGADDDLPF